MPDPIPSIVRQGALSAAVAVAIAMAGCHVDGGSDDLGSVEPGLTANDIVVQSVEQLARDRAAWQEDGALHVVLCGSGSSQADPSRASACTAVIAGRRFFLVDVGPGTTRNLARFGLRGALSGILLTRFQADHIGELGEIGIQSWVGGRSQPLAVYGPPGIADVVGGFRRAYSFDRELRGERHGESDLPPEGGELEAIRVDPTDEDDAALVFEGGGLRVEALLLDRGSSSSALAYRFDYGGRSVVVTGGSEGPDRLSRWAQGVDVLIHDATAPHLTMKMLRVADDRELSTVAQRLRGDVEHHATPSEALAIAAQTGAAQLVLTHLSPAIPQSAAEELFLSELSAIPGSTIRIGRDGMHLRLPSDSHEIESSQLAAE